MKRGPRPSFFDPPMFSTMAQMAGATGIPEAVQKEAKKAGCPAFRNGRIDLVEFMRWFFNRPITSASGDEDDDGKTEAYWAKRNKRAATLMREVELEARRHQVIDFTKTSSFIRELVMVIFFGELDRLANEIPANLKGKTEIQMHEECVRQSEMIKAILRKKYEGWEAVKGES